MNIFDIINEGTSDNLVVVYPGRFHPFHIGHGMVYRYLVEQYSNADVYIASSNKTDAGKSPFTFDEKKQMMALAGVKPNAIVQTRVPYLASEITDNYDPDTTVVVYAVSEKDMAEDPRFKFPETGVALKKNGEPAHMQKWPGMEAAKTFRQHSYVATVPTFDFKIDGEVINSATQIRNMIANADDQQLIHILQQLYKRNDIPQNIVSIFKQKLGTHTVSENWEETRVSTMITEAELTIDLLRTLNG